MTRAAFLGNAQNIQRVYAMGRYERVAELTDLHPQIITAENFEQQAPDMADVEVVFSTWGMLRLDADQLQRLPNLKLVLYGAGSVQSFAKPLLEHGVRVVSAWRANAIPVAEYTLAQIILANKGFYRNAHQCSTPEGRKAATRTMPGNFAVCVALLGAGAVGRAVIQRLKMLDVDLIVYDPFLSDEQAASLGVERVSLEDAFARGHVVSNHLANKPEIEGLLNAELFRRMPRGATFINTGRGAQVREDDLVQVFTVERPDLTALLDVTFPEPPAPDSPLYGHANILITSHIAGALGNEVIRMADWMIDAFLAWRDGHDLEHEVTLDMLQHMA